MGERMTNHVRPPPAEARSKDNKRSAIFRPGVLKALSDLMAELPELESALPTGMGPVALRYFANIDADQDGFVTRNELRAHLKAQVGAYDGLQHERDCSFAQIFNKLLLLLILLTNVMRRHCTTGDGHTPLSTTLFRSELTQL
jgi:hypothetical protein